MEQTFIFLPQKTAHDKLSQVIRKISAHYYLNEFGDFKRFPIISIKDGLIIDIEQHDHLPEISGLEFYSGALVPLMIDVQLPIFSDRLAIHSKLQSSFVSRTVIFDSGSSIESLEKLDPQNSKILFSDHQGLNDFCRFEYNSLSIFQKIDRLVDCGRFACQKDGIFGFSYFLTDLLGCKDFSRICVGAIGQFVLCNDLGLVKVGAAKEGAFRRLY